MKIEVGFGFLLTYKKPRSVAVSTLDFEVSRFLRGQNLPISRVQIPAGLIALVAHLVERVAVNHKVAGSKPARSGLLGVEN